MFVKATGAFRGKYDWSGMQGSETHNLLSFSSVLYLDSKFIVADLLPDSSLTDF